MSSQPHYGYIDSDRVYTQATLKEILGITDERRMREKLREYGCEPVKLVRVNLYPGRLVMLALERAAMEGAEIA